jgi:hypothetical protein
MLYAFMPEHCCCACCAAVLQFGTLMYWYAEKSKEQGIKLDLTQIHLLRWGAFFLLVFLGQVLSSPEKASMRVTNVS